MDLRYEHLPVWDATQKSLRAGDSPFWIDGEYCGHPLLFTQEAPIFYPLLAPLLASGAPVARAADLFSLFHFWLAGFAAFLLLRGLEASGVPALFGGVAWMLSARMVQTAIWPNAVAVCALLPLILLGVVRLARGRRAAGVALTAVSAGLALLAARPHVLVAAAPLLAAFSLREVLAAPRPLRALGDLAGALVLAVLLGAPAVLPSALLYPEMSRGAGLTAEARDFGALSPGRDLDAVFLPVDRAPRWPEAAAYPGVLAGLLFLAGLVFATRKQPSFSRGVFWALAAGGSIGLAFAFGDAGPYRLFSSLPLLRGFRAPARYLVGWSLAIALGGALTLAGLLARFRRPGVLGAAAVLLLSADLVAHARFAAPTAPAALDAVEPAVVVELRQRLGTDALGFPRRFRSLARPVPLTSVPDAEKAEVVRRFEPPIFAIGMRYGLESVDGGGPGLERTERLLARPIVRAHALAGVGALVQSGAQEPGAPAADLVVESAAAFPRAMLFAAAMPVRPQDALSTLLSPAVDPARVAVVEDAGGLAPARANDPTGEVRLVSRRPSRVELATDASSDRVLVLFDSLEKGWRAEIDGVPAEVFPADVAFRGVRVPGGRHRVVFAYRPPGLREGAGLFAAGALGLALASLRRRPRN